MTVQLSDEVFHIDHINVYKSENGNVPVEFLSGIKGWRFSIPNNVANQFLKDLQEHARDVR